MIFQPLTSYSKFLVIQKYTNEYCQNKSIIQTIFFYNQNNLKYKSSSVIVFKTIKVEKSFKSFLIRRNMP